MKAELERKSRGYQILAMEIVIVLLAGGLAYVYLSTSSEISSLKQSGQEACNMSQNLNNPLVTLEDNATNTLKQQVASDDAMIASLNSSKPAGYASLVGTLTQQVVQDQTMLGLLNNLTLAATSLGPNPCTAFR